MTLRWDPELREPSLPLIRRTLPLACRYGASKLARLEFTKRTHQVLCFQPPVSEIDVGPTNGMALSTVWFSSKRSRRCRQIVLFQAAKLPAPFLGDSEPWGSRAKHVKWSRALSWILCARTTAVAKRCQSARTTAGNTSAC